MLSEVKSDCAGPSCARPGKWREDFHAHLCDTHAGLPSYAKPPARPGSRYQTPPVPLREVAWVIFNAAVIVALILGQDLKAKITGVPRGYVAGHGTKAELA